MATSSTVLSLTDSGAQPQSGAASGATASYQLATLEQPRFFYGQLLTDQDLNALLGWAAGRLRLARHREGWGVACGLELSCDPKQDGRVIVGPGYAVSACGDDIVVPALSDPFDLSRACVETPVDCGRVARAADDAARPTVTIGGLSYFADELRYVDLFLRLREEGASPQTALGRRVSGQVEVCEHSRTREGYELDYAVTCQQWAPPSDPGGWHEQYDMIAERLIPLKGQPAGQRAAELLKALGEDALRSFPFVHDLIAAGRSADGMGDAAFFLALFFLIQDGHSAFIASHRRCVAVMNDRGVPLGRVRVQVRSQNGVRSCHILEIDAAPPFRRELGPESLPARPGTLNLGRLIWLRAEQARLFLAGHCISASFEPRALPSSAGELDALFARGDGAERPLYAAPGDEVTVLTVRADEQGGPSALAGMGERVVAIRRARSWHDPQQPETKPAAEPLAKAEPEPEPEPEAPKAQLASPRRRR